MLSVASRRPVATKTVMVTIWPMMVTVFFDMRSATAPPKGPRIIEARPWPTRTSPTAPFRPVRSKATMAWTMVDMKKAVMEPSEPAQRMAKLRMERAAKELRTL